MAIAVIVLPRVTTHDVEVALDLLQVSVIGQVEVEQRVLLRTGVGRLVTQVLVGLRRVEVARVLTPGVGAVDREVKVGLQSGDIESIILNLGRTDHVPGVRVVVVHIETCHGVLVAEAEHVAIGIGP